MTPTNHEPDHPIYGKGYRTGFVEVASLKELREILGIYQAYCAHKETRYDNFVVDLRPANEHDLLLDIVNTGC